jgi:hypothetical protein
MSDMLELSMRAYRAYSDRSFDSIAAEIGRHRQTVWQWGQLRKDPRAPVVVFDRHRPEIIVRVYRTEETIYEAGA